MSNLVKDVFCTAFLCIFVAGCSSQTGHHSLSGADPTAEQVCANDTFIIYFDDDEAEERISTFVSQLNGDIVNDYRNLNAVTVHFQRSLSALETDNLGSIEGVLSVHKDCMLKLH
ncbi:MAG: hypothetical protein J6M93_00420 [Succinivibrio sp.]|nr:hypothetical protein [Succinivibrio sp.]